MSDRPTTRAMTEAAEKARKTAAEKEEDRKAEEAWETSIAGPYGTNKNEECNGAGCSIMGGRRRRTRRSRKSRKSRRSRRSRRTRRSRRR